MNITPHVTYKHSACTPFYLYTTFLVCGRLRTNKYQV